MLTVNTYDYQLEFEYPFTISKGTKTHQPTLVVSLGLGQLKGFGEAPAIHYYNATIAEMLAVLEEKKGLIQRYALTDPQRFCHFLEHLLPGQHFLVAALDIAGWDLFAKMRRMPLYRLLGFQHQHGPKTDYTIGIDSPEKMLAKMLANAAPSYKIKISKPEDIDILVYLRSHTDKPFRLDANEAFEFSDAEKLLPEWIKLGVELVEQPLKKADWESMILLKSKSTIPIFADESCVSEYDVTQCAESFHGINIKLTKCGGITPALRMIKQAKKLGLKVMMGSMNESTIGTAAVAHLLPLLDYVDADGPLLLCEDIADGLIYDNGKISVSQNAGLGINFWHEKHKINRSIKS